MKKCAIAACLLVCILSGLAAETDSADKIPFQRFAIFIGSNKGGPNRQQLVYAHKDASEMAKILGELGGIERTKSTILKDPDPAEIDRTFAEMREIIKSTRQTALRTEFILYYSGHSDEEGILLGQDRYAYKKLRENIQDIEADVHIAILDSCYSGAFTRLKGGTRRAPFLLDESVDTRGHAYLTSSSENEAAQESDSIEGSFFTHYLLAALRGAADTTSLDRKITLNEAYSYASSETLARTQNTLAGPQHAMYDMNLTGSGDLVLTDLRTTDSTLELKRDIAGRLFIRDTNANLAVELRKTEGVPVSLALSPGYYSVTLQGQDSVLVTDFILRSGKNTTLAQQDFTAFLPETTRMRGDSPVVETNGDDSPTLPPDMEAVKQDALRAIERFEQRLHRNSVNPRKSTEDSENAGPVNEIQDFPPVSGQAATRDDTVELVHVYNSIGLIRGDINSTKRIVSHNLSMHLVGSSYRVEGIELGLINLVDEDVKGTQFSASFNLVGGNFLGLQYAGFFNLSDGDLRGAQIAGIFNLAGNNINFFQAAGIFNIVDENMTGLQCAGLFNLVDEDTRGVQSAGLFNISGGQVTGGQFSSLFNSALSLSGIQVATVNKSRRTSGIQTGLVNIGGDTSGLQLGLVNIANRMDGFAIGLINISANGLNHPVAWFDDSKYFYGGYQLGSRPLYTLIYTGWSTKDFQEKPLVFGLGMGVHFESRPLYLDIDLTAKNVAYGSDNTSRFTEMFNYSRQHVFPNIRGTLGLRAGKKAAVFCGVSADIHIPGVTEMDATFHSGSFQEFKYSSDMESAKIYPKWFAGFRL